MKFKNGDRYFREYIIYDDEGEEVESFTLIGEVVFADEDKFIVLAEAPTGAEIANYSGLLYKDCKEMFPEFDYNKFVFGEPLWERFVPLYQDDESFVFQE